MEAHPYRVLYKDADGNQTFITAINAIAAKLFYDRLSINHNVQGVQKLVGGKYKDLSKEEIAVALSAFEPLKRKAA